MDNKTICIYHANCSDGFTAAWVVHKKFPDAEFLPMFYGVAPPDVTDKKVIIVDFSFPKEVLQEMRAKAASLIVLDHHKTAQAALKDLDYCIFDMDRSGAGLAWDYFFSSTTRPRLVDYVEDRDIWRNARYRTEDASTYIMNTEKTFDNWDQLEKDFEDYLHDTVFATADKYKIVENNIINDLMNIVRTVTFDGIPNVAMINGCISKVLSDTLNRLCITGKYSCALMWGQWNDGTVKCSLRSMDTLIDVSEVAKRHGGGGHRNAAVFNLPNVETLLGLVS